MDDQVAYQDPVCMWNYATIPFWESNCLITFSIKARGITIWSKLLVTGHTECFVIQVCLSRDFRDTWAWLTGRCLTANNSEDLTSTTTFTFHECMEECDENADCVGGDWYQSSHKCYLKKKIENPKNSAKKGVQTFYNIGRVGPWFRCMAVASLSIFDLGKQNQRDLCLSDPVWRHCSYICTSSPNDYGGQFHSCKYPQWVIFTG